MYYPRGGRGRGKNNRTAKTSTYREPSLLGSEVSAEKTPLDNFDCESCSKLLTIPSDAEKPFDASILRSSDSVDFFVLKAIFCLASPVFDNMFSIPQEGNEGESTNETKNGLPVVDLAEDSTTFYNLLHLLYPYAKEPTNTLEVYTRVAEAAEKYAMDETDQKLRKLVMICDAMVKEPVATFAVTVRFRWVEVIREAALNSLAIPLRDLISGDGQSKYLHFISAADYRDLLSWHFACQEVLRMLFENSRWMGADNVNERYIRRMFSPHLLKRLKKTGCARSTTLMDDRVLDSGMMSKIFDETSAEQYSNARESMVKDIENALSKVPLKINGILIQAGDSD